MPSSQNLLPVLLNFDIDTYLNPFVPKSILPALPRPISHFLGYRPAPPPDLPPTLITLHATVAAFTTLLLASVISHFAPAIHSLGGPALFASLGAGAVLDLCLLGNPHSQPRPTILGQVLSATVGAAINSAFTHSYGVARAVELEYLSAPLAAALALTAMRLTNTVHPPGGATAILAVTTPGLGWKAVPLVAIGSSVMVAAGCVLNNIGRRWPVWWWTEADLPVRRGGREERYGGDGEKARDEEEGEKRSTEAWRSSGTTEGVGEGICPCCGRGP